MQGVRPVDPTYKSSGGMEDGMGELRLDGKVALVTGAGRGLGRSYANLLASRGASVVVNDPGVSLRGEGGDQGPASTVAADIRSRGGKAVANFESVATESGAAAVVAQALDSFGRIDIVVNNAGIFMPERDFLDTTSESFLGVWQVHVMGSINVTRAAWPHLLAQSFGRVINTTSHVGYLGCRGLLEYSVAKAAIHGFTRSLALEAEGSGVTVNAVAPGAMTRPVADLAGLPETFASPAYDASLVAPTLVWLAHADCDANGEVFGVMAGTTTRIKVAETDGFHSRRPTPETVRDSFGLVMDAAALDESRLIFSADAKQRGAELLALYDTF
jgi:NAD(P)-dependent dehydrogenase (short-subunit alcohol dehydrogenase family)